MARDDLRAAAAFTEERCHTRAEEDSKVRLVPSAMITAYVCGRCAGLYAAIGDSERGRACLGRVIDLTVKLPPTLSW